MAVRHGIALVVVYLLVCGFAEPASGQTTVEGYEAKVREIERRSPSGQTYADALAGLYHEYMPYGGVGEPAKAARTARKLWQLFERANGPADELTLTWMQSEVDALLREDSPASLAKARPILDQALGRLANARKRNPDLELGLLERKAYLAREALPSDAFAELASLERITAIIEGDADAFSTFALLNQRFRVAALKERVGRAEPSLLQRVQAVGRRIWLVYEAHAIKCAAMVHDDGIPRIWRHPTIPHLMCYEDDRIGALAQLYRNQWLDAAKILKGYSAVHLRLHRQDSAQTRDDSMDPRELASRGLDVLPGIADDQLKKGEDYDAPKPLETILVLGASAPDLPGAREKVIRAAELLLPLQRRRDARETLYGHGYVEALEHVVSAYKAVAPELVDARAAELDAARSLTSVLDEDRRDPIFQINNPTVPPSDDVKARVRGAIDRSIAVLGKDSPDLFDFFFLLFKHAREGAGLELIAVDRLFELLGSRSPAAIEFAARVVRRYSGSIYGPDISEGQAFRLGMRILPAAEQVFGLQDRVTQDIVAAILVPSLKLASDADRQSLLEKSGRVDLRPDWNLRSALAARGAGQAALRMAWRMIRDDRLRLLSLDSYEMISILGDQSDLAAYAEKMAAFDRRELSVEGVHDIARTLRGDCDTGVKLRDRLAAQLVQELNKDIRKGASDAALPALELLQRLTVRELTALGILSDRVAMDCYLRSKRFTEAVGVIKSPFYLKVLSKRFNLDELSRSGRSLPANPMDLRPALALASIADWSGAEDLLKRLLNVRADVYDNWAPTLFDTLAALKYAPGMSAPQVKATAYLKALWHAKGASASATDVDRAFQVAQRNELGAAVAIARMAARGLGGPDLADAVRKLQDLDQKLDQIRSSSGLVGGDKEREVQDQRAAILSAIASRFPRYYEQLKPRALGLAEAQNLLAPDEALILTSDTPAMFGTPEETFIIVVTQKEFRWARSALGTEALKVEVAALRCGLDAEEWATVTKQRHCGNLLDRDAVPDDAEPLPFHLGRAHKLYETLLGPFDKLIAGKRLLVVPSGPLTSLPFNVLVTAKPRHALPTTFEQYYDVAWLGTRNALVTLPAVSSLVSLRAQLAGQPRAPAYYAGYGNPVLTGDERYCRRSAEVLSACPSAEVNKIASAEPHPRGRGGRRSGATSIDQIYARGRRSAESLDQVRALCPLPDTEYEISCVAAHFPASGRLLPLRLREKATERDIKALSQSGELSRYRILHFATHGLLAGDVSQIAERDAEPALVLTPPETPDGPDDDGLLTASEVAALKLNADWVVLSACNTAAGEKIGAEALSGLARSFFYAGARSLLVSHWPVYSDAAVRLATYTFAELDRDAKAGRAEALRRSMAALMQDRSSPKNAHPERWAPFVVVGEGGSDQFVPPPLLLQGPTPVTPPTRSRPTTSRGYPEPLK